MLTCKWCGPNWPDDKYDSIVSQTFGRVGIGYRNPTVYGNYGNGKSRDQNIGACNKKKNDL